MHRRALVLVKFLVAVPLSVCAIGAATYVSTSSPTAPEVSLVPTGADVESALRRVGITPESLAAAGLSGAAAAQAVAGVEEYLLDGLAGLRAADSAYASARQDVDRLERIVVAGNSSQDDRSALAAARTALATAAAARDAAHGSVFEAATAHLEPERLAALQTIRSNAAAWDQPVQYLAVSRGEAQRVELREALAAVRIAGEQGATPDQDAVNVVNTWNGDPAVAAATTNLSTNLPAVTQAWGEAFAR
jgi:hypothetical protein